MQVAMHKISSFLSCNSMLQKRHDCVQNIQGYLPLLYAVYRFEVHIVSYI